MRLEVRIESDGTAAGTRVCDKATGEEFENVQMVEWKCEVGSPRAVVTLKLIGAHEMEATPNRTQELLNRMAPR